MSTYRGVNARLSKCLNSVLNVKALVGAFNQEKALVGAFSAIVQLHPINRFAALVSTVTVHSIPNISGPQHKYFPDQAGHLN